MGALSWAPKVKPSPTAIKFRLLVPRGKSVPGVSYLSAFLGHEHTLTIIAWIGQKRRKSAEDNVDEAIDVGHIQRQSNNDWLCEEHDEWALETSCKLFGEGLGG